MHSEPNVLPDRGHTSDWRYRSLLEVMDLVALHTRLDRLLPDLAECLQKVVDFDILGVVLPRHGEDAADLFTVLPPAGGPPSVAQLDLVVLPPLQETRLATLWAGHSPVV